MERTQQHFKAIISNHGDETLYDTLSGEIERRLPIVPVSWQRSFGRPAKEVELQATFTKFDPTRVSTSDNPVQSASSILSSRPLLHIYWTSCLDNDTYKTSVRNQILQWQKLLTEKQCENWLIIHVMYQDNSKLNKSKINLPRSSVYDKIKSEFNQKLQEKCMQLWEPDKETLFTKSSESWDALLNQLRNLLVESFGQHLDSFEDRVRLTREKYAHPDWPFLDYFLFHEELALTYQSITLRDDALIQYDEVDALLSQFIINSAGRELPRWLQKFCAMPANWDGVSVSNQNMDSYKEVIKSGNASLIDFRNYVFARQCKLLMLMNRRGAIPSRMMEFLYMVIQEMKLLNIRMQLGATECWTFLTCMQLFQVIETVENKDYEFKSTYAHLYNYMRQKFQYLGQITGLYYNRPQTQEEKNLSALLTDGFGKYPSRKQEMPSSIKLLKVALTSKNSFETLFLDISKKTIHIMNDLKRSHFGMYAGIDLAKFHLQYGRYNEAEMLLEKAWSIYKTQRWEALYTDVLIPLADCQLKHDMHKRYINSITLLSCAECLSFETRNFYSNEMLKLSTDESLQLPVIGMEPVINIKDFHINLVRNKGHIGDCVNVTFTLINELTIDLPCKSICLVLKHSDLDNPKSFSDSHMHTPTHSTFTTPTVSPHSPKKLDDLANTAIAVSLLSDERPKDGNGVNDSTTPTTFLQKIKGHRRTWSKTLTETKSQTNSASSSPTGARSASISSINTYPETSSTNAKKALFADDILDADKPLSPLDKSFSLPNLSVASVIKDNLKVVCFDDIHKAEGVCRGCEGNSGSGGISGDGEDLGTEDQMLPVVSECASVISSVKLQGTDTTIEPPPVCNVTTQHNDVVNVSNSTVLIEPEEEEEVSLDQKLTSKQDFILTPGSNRVELKSDISIEGKFVLHCVNCLIGNVTFYKLLTQLPKDSKSFYMVVDPPKIVWTTGYKDEHLLTTAKQRLHATLLNQPGIIRDGSLLQISSQTGLRFIDSLSVPIQIYPLERDGSPRDAKISVMSQKSDTGDGSCSTLISLPECKPYERVHVYFDVMAPPCELCGGGSGTEEAVHCTHHTLHFSCLWLKGLVGFPSATLACSFYEPFIMTYETVQKGGTVFIKVVLRGVNSISLLLTSPNLTSVMHDDVSFTLLSCDRLSLYGCEECCVLWKSSTTESLDHEHDKENLECVFDIDFQREDSIHESDIAHFSQDLVISFAKYLYSVEVSFNAGSPLITSQPCSATVTVVKLFPHAPAYRLFLLLNTEKKIWNYTNSQDKYHEITFDSNSSSQAESLLRINITSNRAGSVAAPVFFLAKLNITGEVNMDIETDVLVENVKSFHYGEVNYKHSAHNVILFRKDDDPLAKLDML